MIAINRQTILGRVGTDPTVRFSDDGKVANFRVGTEDRYKNRSGELVKETEWFTVVAFGKLAEVAEQYVKKGARIYVEGVTKTRSWEKDGEKHYRTEVVAEHINLLEDKRND